VLPVFGVEPDPVPFPIEPLYRYFLSVSQKRHDYNAVCGELILLMTSKSPSSILAPLMLGLLPSSGNVFFRS
jgi:hypothetical protein